MGYDLKPNQPEAGWFNLGAFSWPVLIEACGYLWPMANHGAQWYCVWGLDERLGDKYPRIMSNDGFQVTAEEARIMARCARNFAAVQRSLPEDHRACDLINKPEGIRRDDVLEALMKTMHGQPLNEKWPVKIRDDFVDKFEKFAEWAEKSDGFSIH